MLSDLETKRVGRDSSWRASAPQWRLARFEIVRDPRSGVSPDFTGSVGSPEHT